MNSGEVNPATATAVGGVDKIRQTCMYNELTGVDPSWGRVGGSRGQCLGKSICPSRGEGWRKHRWGGPQMHMFQHRRGTSIVTGPD